MFLSIFFLFIYTHQNIVHDHMIKNDSSSILYLWQISDFHIDYEYLPYTNPFCSKEMCCRKDSDDERKEERKKAGKYGYPYGECDIPRMTYEKTIDFIVNYPVDPSKVIVVINTGDYTAHDLSGQTKYVNYDHVRYGYKYLYERLTREKGWFVLGTIGNHDTYPTNLLDYGESGGLLDILGNEIWTPWLFQSELDDVRKYGYYSKIISNNIRIISLNTMWVSVRNDYMKKYPDMKDEMYNWLRNELVKSQNNNEKVILISHFSPGFTGPYYQLHGENGPYKVVDRWNDQMLNISHDFSDLILIQLYGHEHVDRYMVIKDKYEQKIPKSVCLICPSVTTLPNSNPTIRLLKYDSDSQKIVDVLTYINIITKSNEEEKMKGNWELEYSMKDVFQIDDISPLSFQKVLDRMETDEQLYDKFLDYRFSKLEKKPCVNECKKELFCSMNFITKDKYVECLNP